MLISTFINQLLSTNIRITQISILSIYKRLTWLNIMEILHCYDSYGVALPQGLTAHDSVLTEAYVTWQWANLYRDNDLIKYALGRYFKELYDDIRLSVENIPLPEWRRSSYFYYLRHHKYGRRSSISIATMYCMHTIYLL